MTSVCSLIDTHGSSTPDQLAVVVGDGRLTYGDLSQQVRRFGAALLDAGLHPGDRISLYLPNCLEYVVAFYGAMRAGMIANPVNSVFPPAEAVYYLRDSGARMLVTNASLFAGLQGDPGAGVPEGVDVVLVDAEPGSGQARFADLVATEDRDLPVPEDDVPACLPYSSGTTGHAKGIVHTHGSLSSQAINSANHLQMRADDVLVQSLPLVHLYPGNIIMGGLFTAGATMVVQPTFNTPELARMLSDYHATCCAGVPTTYALLLQLDEQTVSSLDLHTLQIAYSAGAPLASRIGSEFRRRYGAQVLDCYGITEAAGNLAANLRYLPSPNLSCGVPYPQTEIRLVDKNDRDVAVGEVGQLLARGPQIMVGYWNRPEETATALLDGWLHTGDLARRDEDGFYYIVDRVKDMIITGGYNVYPAEVEEVVQGHPDVALGAVFSVPDDVKGEKPWAAVVPAAGRHIDLADLEAHCRRRLAAYKVPRRFLVVDELPRNSVGKILRRALRDHYAEVDDQVLPAALADDADPKAMA